MFYELIKCFISAAAFPCCFFLQSRSKACVYANYSDVRPHLISDLVLLLYHRVDNTCITALVERLYTYHLKAEIAVVSVISD